MVRSDLGYVQMDHFDLDMTNDLPGSYDRWRQNVYRFATDYRG